MIRITGWHWKWLENLDIDQGLVINGGEMSWQMEYHMDMPCTIAYEGYMNEQVNSLLEFTSTYNKAPDAPAPQDQGSYPYSLGK
jgi:hypothetical protein